MIEGCSGPVAEISDAEIFEISDVEIFIFDILKLFDGLILTIPGRREKFRFYLKLITNLSIHRVSVTRQPLQISSGSPH